jgi:hypothetical protein
MSKLNSQYKTITTKAKKYRGVATVMSSDNWKGKLERVFFDSMESSTKKAINAWFDRINDDSKLLVIEEQ